MIITLIGIGIGIRGFNSEDSDTKTTIKKTTTINIIQKYSARIEKSFTDWRECT